MNGRRMVLVGITIALLGGLLAALPALPALQGDDGEVLQMEYLDRGAVAIRVPEGVFLSWRLLGTEDYDTAFTVLRNGEAVAEIRDRTNYTDPEGTLQDTYCIAAESGEGKEGAETAVWENACIRIPLEAPEGGFSEDGVPFTYTANDAACADLDGDGDYELILRWDPTNSFDSGERGNPTGRVYIDAYRLDGQRLWRMDLGINIPAGAHFTQIAAYDFDLDGRAELAFKTAPGTLDGTGHYVTEASRIAAIRNADNTADLRYKEGSLDESYGRALAGDEYYTVFQGDTGAALDTVWYPHPRGTISEWGDDRGNRSERYLTAVAYLDGRYPSVIAWRGYYGKTTATAFRLIDKRLVQVADFDTSELGDPSLEGQGNHNLAVGDADLDGRDEVFCGSLALDDDFSVLWCSGRGHGDALHLADYDPLNPGLEYVSVHETGSRGMTLYAAATGEEMFHQDDTADTRRGMMAHTGYTDGYFELWGAGTWTSGGLKAVRSAAYVPGSINFRLFWDGDLYDDLLDGTLSEDARPTVEDPWLRGGEAVSHVRIDNREGLIEILPDGATNNGTKNNVCLTADLFGDWREEIVVRSDDGSALLVYTTTIPTEHRLYTLMHDRTYRVQVATQNAGYNQPPHLGYCLSEDGDKWDRRRDACRIRTVHNGETRVRDADRG